MESYGPGSRLLLALGTGGSKVSHTVAKNTRQVDTIRATDVHSIHHCAAGGNMVATALRRTHSESGFRACIAEHEISPFAAAPESLALCLVGDFDSIRGITCWSVDTSFTS